MSFIISYNPVDWYWIVAGNMSQVWSSARVAYVPTSDAQYAAFLADGKLPTRILNAAELYGVLSDHWAPIVMANGVNVTSTATPALNGVYGIDAASTANVVALSTGIAAGKPLPGGGNTFLYRDIAGVPHEFSAANFLNLAAALEGYVYNFGMQLQTLLGGGTGTFAPASVTIA